ncbi:hypothetical protein [Pulveribacter sp.]|uniref:hypothetical protein n=1 Tax=Pulveribacter sp. TaxID=2678893 RepID=UPI0028ABE837|nr:hypothetical protein [Pulveribacter sp.]
MIEYLEIGRSGYFYQRKRQLSGDAISKLFRALRGQARKPSQNIFNINRVALGEAYYSAICFSRERDVSFLSTESNIVERVFGYMLLVECGAHVAIFKSGLDIPSTFKTQYLGKISNERVERAIARHDAVFEKLRLRNMSISPLALRSKTLEASDLENTVATSSASRFIPQAYSVRRPDGIYSATPTTGRISVRADRAELETAVIWATEISTLLESDDGAAADFIRSFARSIELTALPAAVRPTFVGIDTMELASQLYEQADGIRLTRSTQNGVEELSNAELNALLAALEFPFPVLLADGAYEVKADDGLTTVATLRINATRIALRGLSIPAITNISVERRELPVGEDDEAVALTRYIDREDLFTVLFSDLSLAYIDGTLFRDEGLAGGGAVLLAHLQTNQTLLQATSEKGTFAIGQVSFTQDSVFGSVVDIIAANDDVLVCDDLGDEWADFIGISTGTSPAMISFYHAKHGDQSLSASAFHDSVGQAIKNLGRMSMPAAMLPNKLASWSDSYRNDGVQTDISRLIRGGTAQEIGGKIEAARSAPDVLHRVFIVTSSLSRADVQNVLAQAAQGNSPTPHFVQLYWLLMSYFSACAEMGVRGYVVCRP